MTDEETPKKEQTPAQAVATISQRIGECAALLSEVQAASSGGWKLYITLGTPDAGPVKVPFVHSERVLDAIDVALCRSLEVDRLSLSDATGSLQLRATSMSEEQRKEAGDHVEG